MAGVLGGPWEGHQGHVLTPPTSPIFGFLVHVLGLTLVSIQSHTDDSSLEYPELCIGIYML